MHKSLWLEEGAHVYVYGQLNFTQLSFKEHEKY